MSTNVLPTACVSAALTGYLLQEIYPFAERKLAAAPTKTDDDHFGCRVDVNKLAVLAHRQKIAKGKQ